MADTWTDLYKSLRSKWIAERGPGPVGPSGARLPKMKTSDGMLLLSFFVDDFLRALRLANDSQDDRIPPGLLDRDQFIAERERRVLGGGAITPERQYDPYADAISLRIWLEKGRRVKGRPLTRTIERTGGIRVPYTLWGRDHEGDAEAAHLISKWNAVLDQVAIQLAIPVTQRRSMLSDAEVIAFWKHLWLLVAGIETVVQYPHPSTRERILGGIKHAALVTVDFVEDATVAAADVAGRAAAHVATTAGRAAGSAVEGFFDEAGVTAIITVAIAAFIALR